ncbi:uncharacterized protein LOC115944354 isoform X2 [Leptonychotes weddellii]|uniref:Uncharacterized protein LOC115944354 isoform X2 n=1 Tax=Leptonychotes weddellii TaxID=9713 RepID=A0A7F8RQS8_LEPWE|nr:uncharacterized protein LOC115944354 isoform X2 [Leptonychotes weddellii]
MAGGMFPEGKGTPTSSTTKVKRLASEEPKTGGVGTGGLCGGRGFRQLPDVLFRNRPVPRKQLFAERLWYRLGDCVGVVTMFLSAVTFAKSKSK